MKKDYKISFIMGEEFFDDYGKKSIIIQDSLTGAMLYLKKGKDHERFQNFH